MAFVNAYGYQPTYGTYLPQQSAMQGYGAQQYAPQMGGMQQMQAMQQQQQSQQAAPILWVQGEAGAKSYLVAPGQTLLLMDSESETFYIKATDASGVPMPLRTFDYKERAGAMRSAQAAQAPAADYVTRAEYDALAGKLADVMARLDAIMYPQQAAQPEQPQRMRRGLREESAADG